MRVAAAVRRGGRDLGRRVQLPLGAARAPRPRPHRGRSSGRDHELPRALLHDVRQRSARRCCRGGSCRHEAGYGVSSDILSHVVDLATMLVGPITKVFGTHETFIRQRPLPQTVGFGAHYARGRPEDPMGDGDQRGLRRGAGRVRRRGQRHVRVLPFDDRPGEPDGVRRLRHHEERSGGTWRSSTSCRCASWTRTAGRRAGTPRCTAATATRTTATSCPATPTASASRT